MRRLTAWMWKKQLMAGTKCAVLLVCMGNICRSPTAAGVLMTQAQRLGVAKQFEFDSAGTQGSHAGEAPDRRALQAAARRGYDLSRLRARRVTVEDFLRFDLILAMDRDNLAALERLRPVDSRAELALFLSYADGHEAPAEVPDPYYGGMEGFERVLDLCEAAARGLLQQLMQRP